MYRKVLKGLGVEMSESDVERFDTISDPEIDTNGLSRFWYYIFCAFGLIYMALQFILPIIEHR
jgi:hypothetical protein